MVSPPPVHPVLPSAYLPSVGIPEEVPFAAKYPARTYPISASMPPHGRLGAGIGYYSFTV